jgi:hypothetical protein
MKTRILFLLFFVANYSFSQSVDDYKAVIIPLKYEFLKTENQYRLQTLTKFNLQKAGFISFYNNQSTPSDFNDRCSLLYIEVKNESTFLTTKLQITFKDCNDNIVFQSVIGKSKEKEYEKAYVEALNEAFKSVYDLQYKYNAKVVGTKSESIPNIAVAEITSEVIVPVIDSKKQRNESKIMDIKGSDLLYAQPTTYGYQLIDSEPKVIIKLYKTSNPSSFIAIKGSIQGVLVSKENQWLFEYYQNDQLITEIINVKF